jgi:hypothetical protein
MVRMLKRVSNVNVTRVRKTTSALGVATVAARAAKRPAKNKAAVALGKLEEPHRSRAISHRQESSQGALERAAKKTEKVTLLLANSSWQAGHFKTV